MVRMTISILRRRMSRWYVVNDYKLFCNIFMKKLLLLFVAVAMVANCKKAIQVPDKVQVEEITTLLEEKEVNVDMLVAYLPEFVDFYEQQVDRLCIGNLDDVQKEEMKMQLPKIDSIHAKIKQIAESTDDEDVRYELNRCNARINTKLQLSKHHLVDSVAAASKQPEAIKQDATVSTRVFSPSVETTHKNAPTLYYVVVASRDWLDDAASFGQNMPDGLESPVFKSVANGKTVYRVCCGCYASKKEAKEIKALLKDYYYIDSWIWKDETNAQCVYRPTGGNGRPVDISQKVTSHNDKMVYASSSDGFVNIRRSASANSTILGELRNDGDGANYLGKKGKWYKVNYYGVIGYVNSDYCYLE